MAETTFRIVYPDETLAEVRIVMTIAKWRAFASAVDGKTYHTSLDDVLCAVRDSIASAERAYSGPTS